MRAEVPIDDVAVSAFTIPTDSPESDGTLEWDSTTLVVVEISAGAKRGLGLTYADLSTATLVKDRLADILMGRDAMAVSASWEAMVRAIRNLGVTRDCAGSSHRIPARRRLVRGARGSPCRRTARRRCTRICAAR